MDLVQEGHALLCNLAQQPADVVARRAQQCMQPITLLTLERATIHAVITLEVANDRLNGLAPLEQLSLLPADPPGLAPIAQIDEYRRWLGPAVLHQDRCLLQLLVQLEVHCHVDGLRQQFFPAFLAQQLAELDHGGGVAGLAVFVIGAAREELPAGGVSATTPSSDPLKACKNRWATEASICCQDMREASTASRWRRSIM